MRHDALQYAAHLMARHSHGRCTKQQLEFVLETALPGVRFMVSEHVLPVPRVGWRKLLFWRKRVTVPVIECVAYLGPQLPKSALLVIEHIMNTMVPIGAAWKFYSVNRNNGDTLQ